MKPMKDRWDEALVKWQRLHIGAKLPKFVVEFSKILTEIWANLNPVILHNGFKKTGIYPFNRYAISKNIFDPLILAQWEKEQALNHVENKEVKFVTQFSMPDFENNAETLDKTLCYCTHQTGGKQVHVAVPTLLSLTLQIFNKTANSLENIRSNKNCTKAEVNESKEEVRTEENQIEVGIFRSKFKQDSSTAVKKEGINTSKEDKKVETIYEKKKLKKQALKQAKNTIPNGSKSNSPSKITILQNILIKPAT